MNPDDFITIVHSVSRSALLPKNTLRVNNDSVTLSNDVCKRFIDTATQQKVSLEIAYSEKYKALLLKKGGPHAYNFPIEKTTGTGRLQHLPKSFAIFKVPKGEYKASDENPDIFVYAHDQNIQNNDLSKYYTEQNIKVGDIVAWAYTTHNSNYAVATGKVVKISEKEYCTIQPISENWLSEFPERKRLVAGIKLDKLILREKSNV